MHRLGLIIVVLFATLTQAGAAPSVCGLPGKRPSANEIKVVSWNIQEMAIDKQVYDRPLRTAADFAKLRDYRDCVGGDVYVLEEIASPKALAEVFPTDAYEICFAGQKTADERGLSPDYPEDKLAGIAPVCYPPGASLDGELTQRAYQYVAIVVRRASGLSVAEIRDIPGIGLKNPIDGNQTRWGLEAVLQHGKDRLRILGVHLKSGCSEGPITNPSSDEDCPALALQLPYLKAWVVEAAAKPEPFAVIGDFNRRLDRESADILGTDMWDVISGAATAGHDDDLLLDHIPKAREFKCWPDDPAVLRFSIDFFVLDARALALADPASFWRWRYQGDIDSNTPRPHRPSDHCQIQLNLKF